MELTIELFETTLHRVKGDGGTGGAERRAVPRVGLRSRIKLLRVREGVVESTGIEAWTRDISRNGMGIVTTKRIKNGETYLVVLTSQETSRQRVLFCTVRNCQFQNDIYTAGMSFEELRSRVAA